MKRRIQLAISLVALMSLLALTGCQSVSISSRQYLGGPSFAATDPLQVQILRTAPTRPHVQLGQVTAEPSGNSVPKQEIEQAMQKAAAKMGADAVVIVADRTQVTGAVVTGPFWGRQLDTITGRVIVGVAIHYTGP